jgi:hypothetical protein
LRPEAFLLCPAMGLSNFEERNLSRSWNNEAPTRAASMWVQLHTGDPGEECTANVASETRRKQITMREIANGEWTNENTLEWTGVAATEEITHVSVWDAEREGNPRIYDPTTARVPLTRGQDARIRAEKLRLTLT